jgi:hypothetical protein
MVLKFLPWLYLNLCSYISDSLPRFATSKLQDRVVFHVSLATGSQSGPIVPQPDTLAIPGGMVAGSPVCARTRHGPTRATNLLAGRQHANELAPSVAAEQKGTGALDASAMVQEVHRQRQERRWRYFNPGDHSCRRP